MCQIVVSLEPMKKLYLIKNCVRFVLDWSVCHNCVKMEPVSDVCLAGACAILGSELSLF